MNDANVQVQGPMVRNGVDVDALFATLDAIKGNPEIAKFEFRAKNQWQNGDHNHTTVDGFYAACQEMRHARAFELDNGEPPVLLGADQYPNPVEYVLHALIGCLTTTMVCHAAARGIEIEAIDSELEGDLDVRGFLGISKDVRKGYSAIRVKMRVKSSASSSTLRELAKYSPVHDIVSNSLPVALTVETY